MKHITRFFIYFLTKLKRYIARIPRRRHEASKQSFNYYLKYFKAKQPFKHQTDHHLHIYHHFDLFQVSSFPLIPELIYFVLEIIQIYWFHLHLYSTSSRLFCKSSRTSKDLRPPLHHILQKGSGVIVRFQVTFPKMPHKLLARRNALQPRPDRRPWIYNELEELRVQKCWRHALGSCPKVNQWLPVGSSRDK